MHSLIPDNIRFFVFWKASLTLKNRHGCFHTYTKYKIIFGIRQKDIMRWDGIKHFNTACSISAKHGLMLLRKNSTKEIIRAWINQNQDWFKNDHFCFFFANLTCHISEPLSEVWGSEQIQKQTFKIPRTCFKLVLIKYFFCHSEFVMLP